MYPLHRNVLLFKALCQPWGHWGLQSSCLQLCPFLVLVFGLGSPESLQGLASLAQHRAGSSAMPWATLVRLRTWALVTQAHVVDGGMVFSFHTYIFILSIRKMLLSVLVVRSFRKFVTGTPNVLFCEQWAQREARRKGV